MSFDDDEILQDFLVEAGEIIELLSEQLVDLEQRPDDSDLLNAIFRGFHTVKGGAGFLQLNPLVDCCHVAENVFDILRNGQRSVTPELMDVVLQALDTVNEMFDAVRQGIPPEAADPALLQSLELLAVPESESPAAAPEPVEVEAPVAEVPVVEAPEATVSAEDAANEFANKSGDITDEEFEQLLNALDGDAPAPEATEPAATTPEAAPEETFDGFEDFSATPAPSASDDITEDEFEALLDQLQGKAAPAAEPTATKEEPVETAKSPADNGLIDDSEFEELLDQLHGKGAIGASVEASNPEPEPEPETPASAPVEATPVEATPVEVEKPEVQPAAKPVAAPEPAKAVVPAKAAAPASRGGDKDSAPSAAEATVRVDTKRLDDIMNMVGELVLVRNRLVRLGHKSADEVMAKAVANLDVVTGDLQAAVMKTRMQPIKKVFGRFPRVVRDLARNLKKEVNLELQGEDTDLDKNLVEALADPLVHLVRNSVDHGVESPEVREANGKPRVGTVVLAAEQEGDHILLIIDDDGAGMDANVLRQKVVEKGLLDQDAADRLSDKECFNLIFMPGFSTKDEISDVSGRGVGMDVVKTKITQLNGIIDIDSERGRGTRITIKVPLTLAIMPTLMVMLQDQAFAFPLVSVNEIFHLDLTKTNVVDGKEVVVVREKAIPLFHLKRWLVTAAINDEPSESAHVVVVSVGTQRVGFVVDQLIGQEEVVIKPLGTMLHGTAGMAGATITGDGRIALILDVPSMLGRYA